MDGIGLSKKWITIAFVISGIWLSFSGLPDASRGESYIAASVFFVGAAILYYLPTRNN